MPGSGLFIPPTAERRRTVSSSRQIPFLCWLTLPKGNPQCVSEITLSLKLKLTQKSGLPSAPLLFVRGCLKCSL